MPVLSCYTRSSTEHCSTYLARLNEASSMAHAVNNAMLGSSWVQSSTQIVLYQAMTYCLALSYPQTQELLSSSSSIADAMTNDMLVVGAILHPDCALSRHDLLFCTRLPETQELLSRQKPNKAAALQMQVSDQ